MSKGKRWWSEFREARVLAAPIVGGILLAACAERAPSPESREKAPEIAVTSQALVKPAINAVDDTLLRSDQAFANFGPGSDLGVSKSGAATKYVSLLKFAQTSITSTVGTNNLYSAKLQVQIKSIPQGWGGGRVALHRMTRTWSEGTGAGSSSSPGSGPTWSCAKDTNTFNGVDNCASADKWSLVSGGPNPLPYLATPSTSLPIYSPHGNAVIEFDVTADVTAFLAGTPNHGWALVGTTSLPAGNPFLFNSSETSSAPKLVLDVGPDECPNDSSKVAAGQCGCGRPETDTDGDGDPDCKEPSLVPVADTTLAALDPYENNGPYRELGATTAAAVAGEYTLVRFDQAQIAAAVGTGNVLFGAELEFTILTGVGWGGQALEIFPMNRSWVEGNGLDSVLGAHGASWACADDTDTTDLGNWVNNCTTANKWGMTPQEGTVPFGSVATDSAQVYSAGPKKVRFDVTDDVRKFLSGTPNNGWLIKGRANESTALWALLASRETATPPRLYINAGPTCGTPAQVRDQRGFQREIQCLDNTNALTQCQRRVIAKFNADSYEAATQYIAKVLGSAEVLATVRDRVAKRDLLQKNPARMQQYCDGGDDDEDMVPNAIDSCLQTRPLRPTDSVGCEVTTLPAAPPRSIVDALLGTRGVIVDPRCQNAPIPNAPVNVAAVAVPSTPTSPTKILIHVPDNNSTTQPPGCQLEYQVEMMLTGRTGPRRYGTLTFSSLDFPVSGGATSLLARSDEGGDRSIISDDMVGGYLRVRIMNGNGQTSGWSAPHTWGSR